MQSKQVSIRRQLLSLFGPLLLLLWLAGIALSYFLVAHLATVVFDADLLASQELLINNTHLRDGQARVEFPETSKNILKHGGASSVFYSLFDLQGKLIDGDNNLPFVMPPDGSDVYLQNATVNSQPMRLSAKRLIVDPGGSPVILEIAETTNSRDMFLVKILASIGLPQLLIFGLVFAAVWLGVKQILLPLTLLKEQLQKRVSSDLSPVAIPHVPEEVNPLIEAINGVFARLREEISSHQRLVANAAHQLRTPIAGLKLFSSIGVQSNDFGELKEIVCQLDRGIDRSTRMINQLLALARTDANAEDVSTQAVDMVALVAEATGIMAQLAHLKQLDFQQQLPEHPLYIYANATNVENMVTNLIENAIAYTPKNGLVHISLVDVHETTIFTVEDSGIGIPLPERDKVFERFYRADGTPGSGSGLGLSIVKEVAVTHGAVVTIRDREQGGTIVEVMFPASIRTKS